MKYIYSNAYKKILLISIAVVAVFIIRVVYKYFNNVVKEGFDSKVKWSSDLVSRFNAYQDSVNMNNNQMNVAVLQEQVSSEEVEHFLKTGYWTWSEDIKNLYLESVRQNPMIKIDPDYALDYAMKIYNENSVKNLLSWNTKEGQFLLYGGTNKNNIIKCSDDANPVLQKTIENGGVKSILNIDIENEMPGFTFVNEPCNPCSVLNNKSDYSCPFKLNIKGDNETSDIWKILWNQSV
jgi:hypothetical protein